MFLANPFVAATLVDLHNQDEHENVVLMYLQTMPEFCAKDAEDLSVSTFNGARAALRDLFKDAGALWPEKGKFDQEIADWCRGQARTIAGYRQAGYSRVTIGKRHMYYDLYVALAERYFKEGMMFEWCFHVLTWNLMCRGNSTEAVRWSHIQVIDCIFTNLHSI